MAIDHYRYELVTNLRAIRDRNLEVLMKSNYFLDPRESLHNSEQTLREHPFLSNRFQFCPVYKNNSGLGKEFQQVLAEGYPNDMERLMQVKKVLI